MTNSTVKKKKAKGPIRYEAIIPITIIIALIVGYTTYFFDSHMRRGLQWGATYAHGAEVNIGRFKTNFFAPSMSIGNIQVTNKSKPEFNFIEIGEIKLELLWDALLRGKFVIPESSILDIRLNSKRKRPGRILPVKESSGAPSAVNVAAQKTLNELKAKNESNLLSDLFSLAGGTNYKDQLKKLEGELKSQEKIKQLGAELKTKEAEWKKRLDELPDDSEIKKLTKRVESVKINTKTPKDIQNSLKEIDTLYKEIRTQYKNVEEAQKAFKTDMNKYQSEYKQLEAFIQDDINGMAQKLNIPSLDPAEINKMLLGHLVANQLGNILKYKNLAQEYMPARTDGGKKARSELTPRQRANGVNFRFPITVSYPQFWLKKSQISSVSNRGDSGDLKGTIQNVTNDPKHIKKPATFDFEGGFPNQKILEVSGNFTVDHTTDNTKEFGFLNVGYFPVTENTLVNSKDVSLGYTKADGASRVDFKLENDQLQVTSTTLFKNIDFAVKATDQNVERMVTGITKELELLDMNLKASGTWDNLKLDLNSNLGDKLVNAVKAQISGEVDRLRKEVEGQVRGLVDKEKGKLNEQVASLEKQLGISLKSKEDAVKSIEALVDKKKKDMTQGEKKKIEDKLKKDGGKELKKLLKGVKF